jgi:hypothetical protein
MIDKLEEGKWRPKDIGIHKGHDYSQRDYMRILGEYQKKPVLNLVDPNSILANPGLYVFVHDIGDEGRVESVVFNEPYGKEFIVLRREEGDYSAYDFQTFKEQQFIDLAEEYRFQFEVFQVDDDRYNHQNGYSNVWMRADHCLFSDSDEATALWNYVYENEVKPLRLKAMTEDKLTIAKTTKWFYPYRAASVNDNPSNDYGLNTDDSAESMKELNNWLAERGDPLDMEVEDEDWDHPFPGRE